VTLTIHPALQAPPQLSPREREVYFAWVSGHPRKAIASDMGVEVCTVNTWVDRIREKLGATRAQLVYQAIDAALARQAAECGG
jgi:DNA-binding NarL/FixJ family response regulator